MKIRIIWVGRTKERFLADGIEVYLEKLRPMADIEVIEVKEHKGGPAGPAVTKEGGGILRKAGAFTLLDEKGRALTSLEFASSLSGRARAEFVIGGAYGVSDGVRDAASDVVSLSRMTLTHDMARLVFLEQVYRALMINSGRRYHH